jgi:hypothetical protein
MKLLPIDNCLQCGEYKRDNKDCPTTWKSVINMGGIHPECPLEEENKILEQSVNIPETRQGDTKPELVRSMTEPKPVENNQKSTQTIRDDMTYCARNINDETLYYKTFEWKERLKRCGVIIGENDNITQNSGQNDGNKAQEGFGTSKHNGPAPKNITPCLRDSSKQCVKPPGIAYKMAFCKNCPNYGGHKLSKMRNLAKGYKMEEKKGKQDQTMITVLDVIADIHKALEKLDNEIVTIYNRIGKLERWVKSTRVAQSEFAVVLNRLKAQERYICNHWNGPPKGVKPEEWQATAIDNTLKQQEVAGRVFNESAPLQGKKEQDDRQ